MRGTIKALKPTFGFIKPDNGTSDIFFLPTALQKASGVEFGQLREGQAVEYDVIRVDRPDGTKERAVDILVVD